MDNQRPLKAFYFLSHEQYLNKDLNYNNFIEEDMNIEAFFKDVIEQNREALPAYFNDDAIIRWHCSNEEFTVEEYIRANCEYPGKWRGRIERIERCDPLIILVGKVVSEKGDISCYVTSFIRLENDRIAQMDEYWADEGEAPEWRKKMGIGKTIA